ncbi:MAG TPA: VOC family protein [Chloroflexota bacterium]|jgi:catechol 2,3-dioxygenase-like lactoylglutathione lyase family enzyme|nr:VOC family protein [Chloroflexota bacterium]
MIGVRHLAIRARDLAASRRFYEEGLGLRFVGFRPSGVAVDLSAGATSRSRTARLVFRTWESRTKSRPDRRSALASLV